jgi:hypothetical protein
MAMTALYQDEPTVRFRFRERDSGGGTNDFHDIWLTDNGVLIVENLTLRQFLRVVALLFVWPLLAAASHWLGIEALTLVFASVFMLAILVVLPYSRRHRRSVTLSTARKSYQELAASGRILDQVPWTEIIAAEIGRGKIVLRLAGERPARAIEALVSGNDLAAVREYLDSRLSRDFSDLAMT